MASFVNTVTIMRSISDVFAFLAEFENIPAWNYAVEQTTKTSAGPVAVGTTYRQTRSVPSRSEETFEVTLFEPTSRLGIEGRIGGFPSRLRYLLEPVAGGTRLANSVDLELGPVLRLGGPVVLPAVKRSVAANLETLRQLLETRIPSSAGLSAGDALSAG
jgi:hypothetical protein